MAKVQVLGQRCPHGGKMLIRGVFSQKKKLWAAMQEASLCPLEGLQLVGDMSGDMKDANYSRLCVSLRQTGRATLATPDGTREFQVVETVRNQLRPWDVDEEGPVCNPASE